jgi:alpha-2-macroglobulin
MKDFVARLLGALMCFVPVAVLPASAADPATPDSRPQVESFSPSGYTKNVRQVTARFTVSMVALGDPRLPDPFVIDCPASGKGRWADTRNWAYDFDDDLEAGVSCRFMLRKGLKSVAGEVLAGPTLFSFNTGGPAIIASLPRDGWEALDEDQAFLLRLDASATTASIEANAYCGIEGVVERIPVTVLEGEERRQILDQRRLLGYDYLQLLWKNGTESNVRIRNRSMEYRDARITVLRCQRRLPPATRVLLHWGAGVATASGVATQTDQQLAFRVRSAFIAQVECTRTNAHAGCMPVLPVNVTFTAPVPRDQALAIRMRASGGHLFTPTAADPHALTLENVTFTGPFPPESTLVVVVPADLKDDAGRPLENAARFPLALRIDVYPPLIKFSGAFGILEAREGGILPVTLRNVEAALPARQSSIGAKLLRVDRDPGTIAAWLRRVQEAGIPTGHWVVAGSSDAGGLKSKLADEDNEEDEGHPGRVWRDTTGRQSVFRDSDTTTSFSVAKPLGRKAEEVVGIPLKEPGFYVIELKSRTLGAALLGDGETRYVATSALVTDLAVHFKWGRESSVAWVTRLSSGVPVADAEVTVSDYCAGSVLWKGRSDTHGVARIERSLGEPGNASGCNWRHPLMVLARQAEDFSFTVSDWDQGITPYEFNLPVGNSFAIGIYHTVLDRSLFRAGETVSMKHFLRQHVSAGLAVTPSASGYRVMVAHQGSGQRYPLTAAFDHEGVAVSEWRIPQEAKLGDYQVMIDDHVSAQFKVEQFRLPTMHASIAGPARPLIAPTQVDLDLHVAYLSGGGASGLPVKVRTFVEPRPLRPDGYADYQFGGAPIQEGVVTEGTAPADFDFESQTEKETTRTHTIPLTLDASGSARVTVADLPVLDGPGRLLAELEYADANGEILTTTGFVRLVPAAISLGIRREGWVASSKQIRFRVVALDLDGKPQAQQAIMVLLYQSNAYSYRRRLIGGFYSYETTRETKKLAASCSGVTDAQGLLTCEVAPGASGQIIVRAETHDASGRIAGASTSMWVADEDTWWFGGTSGDRMDVLPEKKEYQAGQAARFQVRMPFRSATALVTVEREGVLTSFVTPLHGNAPIVEVPIARSYSPNVFVSVLAIRGRVRHAETHSGTGPDAREVTALVDLTKPSYRVGTAEIKVDWGPHRLDVEVHPERSVYRVGEKATATIHVAAADGGALPKGSEVAVAAVDEALLDLSPNSSWELLEAMMGQRGLEVWTSTAQMQVVGKRHYGRKAIPHGGGGGRETGRARELFDTLLSWQPRVALDERGDARVTIPLNDSLSAFRIVAIAHSGAERFGTGAASIQTTQDLILLSGLPPLVREGDRYAATVSVRNTTDHVLTAHVQPSSRAIAEPLVALEAQIAAGESRDLTWTVNAPVGMSRIDWDITASAGAVRDHLKVSETVIPAVPVRTYQATIVQLTKPLTAPAAIPRGAVTGRGGLEITLQARLSDNLDGVTEYMSRYPYICLEQLASRAVTLRSRTEWDVLMARLPAYMDEDGLLKYFPSDRLQGDDGLTAYILAIANEAGWPISEEQDRLLRALTRFVEGKLVRYSALPTADLSIRKLQAIDALSRYGAARADMLDSITIEPNLLPTSALLDWIGILKRTQGVRDAEGKTREALGMLRARLNFQGTTMGFSSERTDALWWLMISGDSNANRMLLAVLDRPEWREDIPRLVRGALGRQLFGHWNTTVANAWGVLAIDKFSTAFESTPVTGSTRVHYATDEEHVAWPRQPDAPVLRLPWQRGEQTLDIMHLGGGAPWLMVRATAALPLDKPLSTGFKVTRTVTPVEQHKNAVLTRGDVVRVHLDLEAQSDMTWVVVDDPIPGGATPLGSLGGQSQLLKRDDQRTGWAWLAFEERRFDSYRAYYRFVPKGRWTVEYTVRLNNPGTFQLPATRVEAMYAPEMLAEVPNAAVTVLPMTP